MPLFASNALRRLGDPHSDIVAAKMRARVREALIGRPSAPVTAGRFIVLERLGAGGMGTVYAAYDPELDRRVAIKFIAARNSSARSAALAEARSIASLSHTNVLPVFDVGECGDAVYFATLLVEGGTMRTWLLAEGRRWREVVNVAIKAGRGLAAAHASGIVHHDFKPDNVLVSPGGVWVADFGLARSDATTSSGSASEEEPRDSATRHQGGTWGYVAPERLDGDLADERADQFAWSVTLYEALTGVRPFRATQRQDLRAEIECGPDFTGAGRKVPRYLRRVLVRGLAPRPTDRYPSMDALLRAARPRRRRFSFVFGFAAGATVAAAGLMGAKADATPACEPDRAPLWSSSVASELGEAHARAGVAEKWPTIERGLAQYADRWTEAYAHTCRVSGRQANASLRCLEKRRMDYDALIGVLLTLDNDEIASGGEAVAGLLPLETCSDPDVLASQPPDPEDPQQAAQVEAVRELLARAEALLATGQLAEANKVSDDAMRRATEANHARTTCDAIWTQGRILERMGDWKGAYRIQTELAWKAMEAKYDYGVMRGSNQAAQIAASRLHLYEEAGQWARLGAAYAARSEDFVAQATIRMTEGDIALQAGDYDEALTVLEDALRLKRIAHGDEHFQVTGVLSLLALVHRRTGRNDESVRLYREVFERVSTEFGADSWQAGATLTNLTEPLGALEGCAAAAEVAAQGRDILRHSIGPHHYLTAMSTLR